MHDIARRLAAPLFAMTMCVSAALIFALQPMFGRMVTPLLGGSPAVWNASMAFFQAALLVGYVYAHLLARVPSLRVQALIHAIVLVAAFLVLPVNVSAALGPPDTTRPALWLVGVLTLSVGAPFAAVAATAPLMQSWFARTGRADAADPYYLYAASNLGSFAGLIAYPALIEPQLGLAEQSLAWTIGYVAAAALIGLCAFAAIAAHGQAPVREAADAPLTWRARLYWAAAAAIPSSLILGVTLHISTDVASAPLLWVVPLALYLATFVIAFSRGSERFTPFSHFLYAPALAILLASYFATREWVTSLSGNLFGFFVSALVCHLALAASRPHAARLTEFYFWVSLGGVLGGAFAAFAAPLLFNQVYEYPLALGAAALFLSRSQARAPARFADVALAAAVIMLVIAAMLTKLSAPYAVLIAGCLGAAGAIVSAAWMGAREDGVTALRVAFIALAGVLAAFVMWLGFNAAEVFETGASGDGADLAPPWRFILMGLAFATLALVAHAAVKPDNGNERVARFALGAALAPIFLLIALAVVGDDLTARAVIIIGIGFAAVAIIANRVRPMVLACLVLAGFAMVFLNNDRGVRVMTQERTFFGVLRTEVISEGKAGAPELRVLMHGTTMHGAQLAGMGSNSRTPLTYYNPSTALGEAVLAGLSMGAPSHMALIGLGAGASACLTQQTDSLDIYEIDPMVVRLSGLKGTDFTYVQECQPNARVHLGDARLKIAEAPDGAFDVIVVDAFSSDAIPAHLLTREAVGMYLDKTSARGVVLLHLSNRHLALVSEAARVARDLGAAQVWRVSDGVRDGPAGSLTASVASVMIVAKSQAILDAMPRMSNEWRAFEAPPGRAWSDDYINLPRALWESMNGEEECRMYPYVSRCLMEAEAAKK